MKHTQQTTSTGIAIDFPVDHIGQPLLHDKVQALMDGERLGDGNTVCQHIAATVQDEPDIVVHDRHDEQQTDEHRQEQAISFDFTFLFQNIFFRTIGENSSNSVGII